MKNRSFLLTTSMAVVCFLAACPRPAASFIDIRPPTLGNLCGQASHIYVMRVEKVRVDNGVICFKSVEELKADGALPLPDGSLTKQVISPNITGAKIILDWAAEGKTTVLFVKEMGLKSHAHIYIDGYWYLAAY